MRKTCFASENGFISAVWSGQWFQPLLDGSTITIIMTFGTIALFIYSAAVGYAFYYMIRKDFFDDN